MRCILACLVVVSLVAHVSSVHAGDSKPLKVLSIGNSFSGNAHHFLRGIAKSMNCPLVLVNAARGGCSLDRHWRNIESNKADYYYCGKKRTLMHFFGKNRAWDIVTIQQASGLSRFPESYEPAGSNLIAFIRQHAPDAEILVHQTWAYRQDEKRLNGWKITPDQMYDDVAKAYADFAARHDLRIIPCGDAFQLARKTPEWGDYTPANVETGAPATGKTLHKDGFHTNANGSYLAGCVWFEVLFGKDAREIPLNWPGRHPSIKKEDAVILREIAHRAVNAD